MEQDQDKPKASWMSNDEMQIRSLYKSTGVKINGVSQGVVMPNIMLTKRSKCIPSTRNIEVNPDLSDTGRRSPLGVMPLQRQDQTTLEITNLNAKNILDFPGSSKMIEIENPDRRSLMSNFGNEQFTRIEYPERESDPIAK